MSDREAVLEVEDLHKTFHIGFWRKRIEAVRGISFQVRRGEIFGFVGPNGAGKTTTMKMVLQLIYPSHGKVRIFGQPAGDPALRARLGYLPENPYIYTYLKPLEFLDLCARLSGIPRKERQARAEEMIERLSLAHAVDRPIGKFSKGMMQRLGVCQALLHRPEVLVLDEPFSGLDPLGRKDIRNLVLEQRREGRTILLTSHVLSDVEALADSVAIINQGKLSALGDLRELLRPEVRRVEVELTGVDAALRAKLEEISEDIHELEGRTTVVVEGDSRIPELLSLATAAGANVLAVVPHRETLEDLFVRKALAKQTGTGD